MRTWNPIDLQLPPRPSIRVVPVKGERVIVGSTFSPPPTDGADRILGVLNSYKLNQASVTLICSWPAGRQLYFLF